MTRDEYDSLVRELELINRRKAVYDRTTPFGRKIREADRLREIVIRNKLLGQIWLMRKNEQKDKDD